MALEVLAVAVAAFLLSCVLTRALRARAVALGTMDVPNERSSHTVPTPRGGGTAIVIALTLGLVALALLGVVRPALAFAIGGGGLAVAFVGFFDDVYQLSPGVRLTVHLLAAIWALMWLGGLPRLQFATHVLELGAFGYVVGVLGIIWMLNLFNFMDGIDGIAGGEAVFVGWGGALMCLVVGLSAELPAVSITFGAACAGFLVWNWPPARIFMGDVGSGYLGYVIAVLGLAAGSQNPSTLWLWLILAGVFVVDATVTLTRRLFRGQRIYEAHRSHAYQHLARRWKAHKPVTLAVLTCNLLWLLPCAAFAAAHPSWAGWIALGALAPLGILAVVARAGEGERREST